MSPFYRVNRVPGDKVTRVPDGKWAIPFTNPRGRVRWQPALPDGRRKWRTSLDGGWYSGRSIFPPKLYASRWWAERVAQSKWRSEFREDASVWSESV